MSLFFANNLVFAGIGIDSSNWGKWLGPELSEEEKNIKTIEAIKQKIKEEPTNHEHYFALAFTYDQLGLHKEEGKALQNEIKYYPDDKEGKDAAYGNLARVYLILGNLNAAKSALDKAMKINSENIPNYLHLATYYFEKDNIKNTAITLKKLSDIDPQGEQYYDFYNRALFHLEATNSELIALFKKLTEIDPGNSEAYKMYGTALRYDFDNLAENFSLIKEVYQRAIELDPENVYNYVSFGNAYWTRGLVEEENKEYYFNIALKWLKKAKKIDPENYKVSFSLGNCYLSLEENDKAIENLEYAFENEKNNPLIKRALANAYNNKAYSFYKKGESLEKGLELIEKAISIEPESGIYLSTKAELLYKLGKYKEAHGYIKQAIALEPDYLEIQEDFKMIEEALKSKKD